MPLIYIIYDHKKYILHKSLDQMNNKVKHNGYYDSKLFNGTFTIFLLTNVPWL